MSLAICAIFRNEAPYLREWIEFHRIVGVERFYLYQNRSEDAWQPILRPYIEAGIVDLTDWPMSAPCQGQAYQHFIDRHRGESLWTAFIDCDEFLFSPSGETIPEAVARLSSPLWGAIGVNWICFGASGQEEQRDGLVIERFTLRPADTFPPNTHIKTIVRMDRVIAVGGAHNCVAGGGTFNELGSPVPGPFSEPPTHRCLRINHYHTKSRQEYLRRIARGRADGTTRRSPEEFHGYQAADVEDKIILRFLPELKQRLAGAPGAEPYYAGFAPGDRTAPRILPIEFSGYDGCHAGATIIVCGCGSSLSQIVAPERFITIGVNDVGRLLDPDYLVVTNPRNQFSSDRFRYVETSQAKAVFTQLDLEISHPRIVRFRLGQRGGVDVRDSDALPHTRNSPYVAVALALFMGAKRIGLIGVDFTDHHFFGATGRHPLAGELGQIDSEYRQVAARCRDLGVEIYNLSAESRLTAFPKMSPDDFARSSLVSSEGAASRGAKVFFVNYRFLACGDVFSDGLDNAARDLGVCSASASWDDHLLPDKVAQFRPDLLFVVHGRRFSQRWRSTFAQIPSAVWLLDEPYETDDTSQFSRDFGTVFVNDPGSLRRHTNARFLPVCYDPGAHYYRPGSRRHATGFVGGGNPARELMLKELAGRNLLSYTVGGPWLDAGLRARCLSGNIPASETAELYRQTSIVVNVFRTAHHYNREHIQAVSMNPRIYEALACGALVVSERRPEIARLCPELPTFGDANELISTIQELSADPARLNRLRKDCIRRLAGHTYAHRLHTALAAALGREGAPAWIPYGPIPTGGILFSSVSANARPAQEEPAALRLAAGLDGPRVPGWEADPHCVRMEENGVVLFRAGGRPAPGSETGLVGNEIHQDVRLSFEIFAEPGTMFLAKIHQQRQRDQTSNSYHLMCTGPNTYLARHNQVLHSLPLRNNAWEAIALTCGGGTLSVELNGELCCVVKDDVLRSGYCFLGIKSGMARVRNIGVTTPEPDHIREPEAVPPRVPAHDLLYSSRGCLTPRVSIVTTVYDRVECLEQCIRSVQGLRLEAREHIIVADAPPSPVVAELQALVKALDDGRHPLRLAVSRCRANDWGISPASIGLSLAAGEYACFLSDDNGYTPDHFEKLVTALESDPELGFAYSGCLYDGRMTLNSAPPAFSRIDLGQPLFRKELFDRYLGGALPFTQSAWDWEMIRLFIQKGVRWKHVSDATFIFRLAKYSHLTPAVTDRSGSGTP